MKCSTPEAYKLFHEGSLALAEVERNGIRIDVDYLNKTITSLGEKQRDLENNLRSDPVFYEWRKKFGEKASLGSPEQLSSVVFDVLKFPYPDEAFTPTGKYKADKHVMEKVDCPFVKRYFKWKELDKVINTYLRGILRETTDGFLHPFFNLAAGDDEKGGAVSFRSSGSAPNFQNLPSRNGEYAKLVRDCFISRDKHQIGEGDFKAIEVVVGTAYHKDPVMLAYLHDPKSDMHGDTARDLFFLTKEQVDKKTTRDWAKNRMVFAEFYGSVYFQCAPPLWEVASNEKYKLPNSKTSIKEHLASKGIMKLGDCDPKSRTVPGTFVHHVKGVEDGFWNKRFRQYAKWKTDYWNEYLRTGGFDYLTGFRVSGIYKKNDVTNYPIQGAAFHCLLWTLIRLQKWLKRHKMKSLILGQIHDSIIMDLYIKETQDVLTKLHHIITIELPKAWTWINAPMNAEMEVCEPGASWFNKKQWIEKGGVWCPN